MNQEKWPKKTTEIPEFPDEGPTQNEQSRINESILLSTPSYQDKKEHEKDCTIYANHP